MWHPAARLGVVLLALCVCTAAATAAALPAVPLSGHEPLGVPGIPLQSGREAHAQQSGGCLCQSASCGCADGLTCGGNGLCYPCSSQDCRFFGNTGCACGLGTICSQQLGQCIASPNTVPSQCSGLSCVQGQGVPIWDGANCRCQCGQQYTSDNCGQCAYGYTNYPSCVSQTGAGSNCQATYCKNNGAPFWSSGGVCQCQCKAGFQGASCERCAPGYNGYPTCVSDYSQSCSQLLCQNNGQPFWSVPEKRCKCTCRTGFGGDTCGLCSSGYVNYPTCTGPTNIGSTQCTTLQCGPYGVGHWDGVACRCVCNQGYAAASCNQCAAGFSGYPTCIVTRNWGVGGGGGVPPGTVSPPTPPAAVTQVSSDDDNTGLIIAAVVCAVVLLLLCLAAALYYLFCRKAKAKQTQQVKYAPTDASPPPPRAPAAPVAMPPPPVFYDEPRPVSLPPPSHVSTQPAISVISEHRQGPPLQQQQPQNPIAANFTQQSPQRLTLTKENAEHNNFLHRRDGTFA